MFVTTIMSDHWRASEIEFCAKQLSTIRNVGRTLIPPTLVVLYGKSCHFCFV